MAHLYTDLSAKTPYYDKKSGLSRAEYFDAIAKSCTLYIGNLTFYTTEDQIQELFSKCGQVKRVIMGLNRFSKRPCGFCFVEYFTHDQASQAVNLLNKSKFDDRQIRVDWDFGFVEGRQFGRGETGDQWRDDFREDFDGARGGQGRALLKRLEADPDKSVFVGKRRHSDGGGEWGPYKRHKGGKGKGKGWGKGMDKGSGKGNMKGDDEEGGYRPMRHSTGGSFPSSFGRQQYNG